MKLSVKSITLLVGSFLTISSSLYAIPTATWEVANFAALGKGEPKGTTISSEGEVIVGRSAKKLDDISKRSSMVWTSVRDSEGTSYFGTGDRARLFAVRQGKLREVADLNAVLITSLTLGPKGYLFAAVLPGAKIVRIDTRTGKWQQIANLPTEHVWAIHYDATQRRIFAATGGPGKLFSLAENGADRRMLFDAEDRHLLFLTPDGRGNFLTGGTEKAILYRVNASGNVSAIHDFDASELRDVVVYRDGSMLAAVNLFPDKSSSVPRYDRSEKGEAGTPIAPQSGGSDDEEDSKREKVRANELRPGAKNGKGALFVIDPDGNAEPILALAKGYFTDVALDAQGTAWATDGVQGKLFWVQPDRTTVLNAFDFDERQALTLSVEGTEHYVATGDASRIYQVEAQRANDPAYLSDIFNSEFVSYWGNLKYHATAKLRFYSRSGNTAKPDATWSSWNEASSLGRDLVKLDSPPAHYLQTKAIWQEPKGVLRSFTIYYRPKNQRARVTEILVGENKSGEGAAVANKRFKTKLSWKVDNADKDALVYRLFYREELGVLWRPIGGPEPLSKAEFEWDTEAIADGYYRIKVVTSDEPSNGPEFTLVEAKISEPILVDNRAPTIEGLSVNFPTVKGTARDSFSAIAQIEYAIDGGVWNLLSPSDSIYDHLHESFQLTLPRNLVAGAHVIAIRATDSAGNIGVVQTPFGK